VTTKDQSEMKVLGGGEGRVGVVIENGTIKDSGEGGWGIP